ncbi:MAG: cytochrome c oxidase subunit II [Acidimicrobiales bacterium]
MRWSQRWRLRASAAVAATGLVVLGACGDEELPQNTLDPQGPVARQLDDLFSPVFLVAVATFFLVEGLILFALFRFRSRGPDDAPPQIHGNVRMELGWTIAPALLMAVVGFFTVRTILDINEVDASGEALAVEVIGHQFWWEYRYPALNITTANELHIPIGRPVTLRMTSDDVIHSFWPPKLAGKLDVIPGRTNSMEVEADQPGIYYGQCAEYCGESHANMRLRVVAHSQADFDRWAADQQRPGLSPEQVAARDAEAGAGAKLFYGSAACNSCHTVSGQSTATIGPNLTHLFSRDVFAGAIFDLDERNLRRWLRDPQAVKPGNRMVIRELSEEEITQLIAYLETLE